MRDRRFLGQNSDTEKRLSPESAELQQAKASCRMVVKFQDGNNWSKWSNEYKQPKKLVNINDAIHVMFQIVEKSFRGKVHSAAIFDTRVEKKVGSWNKIYQYERGVWKQVAPFTW